MRPKYEIFSVPIPYEASDHLKNSEWRYKRGTDTDSYFRNLQEQYAHPVQLAYMAVLIELRCMMAEHLSYFPEESRNSLIVACDLAEQAIKKHVHDYFRDQRKNIRKLFTLEKDSSEKYITDEEVDKLYILKLRVMIFAIRLFIGENGVYLFSQQIEKDLEKATEHSLRTKLAESMIINLTKLRMLLTQSDIHSSQYLQIWRALSTHLVDIDLPSDLAEQITAAVMEQRKRSYGSPSTP